MASDGPGPRALALIDKLLGERPEKVGHDFSEATRCLTAFREEVIQAVRAHGTPRDKMRLDVINRVLSVILAGHFPLGGVPWKHIEAARGQLAELLREEAAAG
jgi:formate dehydrogenase major subunit